MTTRRLGQVLIALAALAATALLAIGLPAALGVATRWVLRGAAEAVADSGGLWPALTSRDDSGWLPLVALALVGWGAWLTFARSLVSEIAAARVGRSPRRVRGMGPQQRLAAALVAAIALLVVTPAVATASPARAHTPAVATAPAEAAPADAANTDQAATAPVLVYEVAKGDYLGAISARFTGSTEDYPALAAGNGIPDPDLIHPQQRLVLPADAVDRGADAHARGALIVETQTAPDVPSSPSTPTPSASDSGAGESGLEAGRGEAPAPGTSAQSARTPEEAMAGHGEDTDTGTEASVAATAAAAAGLGGAGLLAALVLRALVRRRRLQRRHRAIGRRLPNPRGGAIERELRAAELPVDVEGLDRALRDLATGLAGQGSGEPPAASGVWASGRGVEVVWARPRLGAPEPWSASPDNRRWILAPGAGSAGADTEVPVPLPALATVGSRDDRHLLVDLEYLGVVIVSGDRERAMALMRYLACELACNTWSEGVEVCLVGFPEEWARDLVEIGPERVGVPAGLAEAALRARARVAANHGTLSRLDAPSALAARLADPAVDTWAPLVLLVASVGEADRECLDELVEDLAAHPGHAVAAVVLDEGREDAPLRVTPGGRLHIADPLPPGEVVAAGLPVAELRSLAEVMAGARAAIDEPVPPASEAEPWADGVDAAGVPLGHQAPDPEATDPGDRGGESGDGGGGPSGSSPSRSVWRDATLDDDLRDWYSERCVRPRVGILGQVAVVATGVEVDHRRRFLGEIVVYLAQRGARGADRQRMEEDLWPGRGVGDGSLRVAIARARRWLGETAGGEPWLPHQDADRRYRIAEGLLLDWHLFRRLRARGEASGAGGVSDLREALALVRGVPLDGADRGHALGTRSPYAWLPESEVYPPHLVSAVVDTAHALAGRCLAAGDAAGARWAVERGWRADPCRGDDELWCDLIRAEHLDGHTAQVRLLLRALLEAREAEVPEDLYPQTYAQLREVLRAVLCPEAGGSRSGG